MNDHSQTTTSTVDARPAHRPHSRRTWPLWPALLSLAYSLTALAALVAVATVAPILWQAPVGPFDVARADERGALLAGLALLSLTTGCAGLLRNASWLQPEQGAPGADLARAGRIALWLIGSLCWMSGVVSLFIGSLINLPGIPGGELTQHWLALLLSGFALLAIGTILRGNDHPERAPRPRRPARRGGATV